MYSTRVKSILFHYPSSHPLNSLRMWPVKCVDYEAYFRHSIVKEFSTRVCPLPKPEKLKILDNKPDLRKETKRTDPEDEDMIEPEYIRV